MTPTPDFRRPARRPSWQVLVLALPLALLLNQLVDDVSLLSDLILRSLGWQFEPSILKRTAVRASVHLLLPWLVAFCILRLSRVGDWLVLNRLALAGLLLADGLVLLVLLRGLLLAGLDQSPYLSGQLARVAEVIAVGGLLLGLSSVFLATLWHRLLAPRPRAAAWCISLLTEVNLEVLSTTPKRWHP